MADDTTTILSTFAEIEDIENLQEYGTLIYDNKESNIEQFFNDKTAREYAKFIELPYPGSPIGRAPENCLYISFGHLCTLINALFLYPKDRSEFKKNITSIRGDLSKKSDQGSQPSETGEIVFNYNLSTSNTVEEAFLNRNISYIDPRSVFRSHMYIRSFNPSKVLLLTDIGEMGITNEKEKLYSIIKKNVVKEEIINCNTNVKIPKSLSNIKGIWLGSIECIFLNIQTVAELLEKSPTVSDYLDSILDTINTSVSNYFKLIKDVDESNSHAIKILDYTLLPNVVDKFPVYQKDTVFRNVSLDATLPTKFQVAAYATQDAHSPSQINHNAISGFSAVSNGYYNNNTAGSANTRSKSNTLNEFVSSSINSYHEVFILPFDEPLMLEYEKDFFNVLKYHGTDDAYRSYDYHMPIGINLKLELDGIGGFKYGNAFKLTYIPGVVDPNTVFQITNVEHDISVDSQWTTKLTTALRASSPIISGKAPVPNKTAEYKRDYTLYSYSSYAANASLPDLQELIDANPAPSDYKTVVLPAETRRINLKKYTFDGREFFLNPALGDKLLEADAILKRGNSGRRIKIISGFRPPQMQQNMLDERGRGYDVKGDAKVPATANVWYSYHQSGNAVDLSDYDNTASGAVAAACISVGLYFPMAVWANAGGYIENWHVQAMKEDEIIRDAAQNGQNINFPEVRSKHLIPQQRINELYRGTAKGATIFKVN